MKECISTWLNEQFCGDTEVSVLAQDSRRLSAAELAPVEERLREFAGAL